MKKNIANILLLIAIAFFCYQNYLLNTEISNLKSEVKNLNSKSNTSTSLKSVEYKVNKLTDDKDFFKSLYADNSTWFIGFVSLVVVVVVGFSVYSNKEDLKESKIFTEKKITELEIKYIEFKKEIINYFDKRTEEYTTYIELLNKKLNNGLTDVYFVSSIFYTKLAHESSSLIVTERFDIQILALKSIVILNTFSPEKDNRNLDVAFDFVINIYNSTSDIVHLNYMKKNYLDQIYGLDITSFSPEYQNYLRPKIQEVLLSLK